MSQERTPSTDRGPGFPYQPEQRLRKRPEFLNAYSVGSRRRGRGFTAIVVPRTDDQVRLGISVGRKYGNAVARNRIKRRIRTAFRLEQHDLPTGIDLVMIPRPDIADVPVEELRDEMRKAVRGALEKARRSAGEGNDGPRPGAPRRGKAPRRPKGKRS